MTDRWKEFIAKGVAAAGGPVPFALSQWTFLLPVYAAIRAAVPAGARLLDVGTGAGMFAALVAHHGFDVVAVDEDPEIVEYAKEIAAYLRSPVRIERADAFDLSRYRDRFDLVFSLGVVEHFDRADTVRLIAEQARCGPRVMVSVPTSFTRHAGPITDERIYTRTQLARIVSDAGLTVTRSFAYGDVPGATGLALSRVLPKVGYRALQQFCGYSMAVCALGVRPAIASAG
jgi:2-polyprenyl-3-methyl-5-hydroxy-6-metoxy-1,4-benzoquinol methylase